MNEIERAVSEEQEQEHYLLEIINAVAQRHDIEDTRVVPIAGRTDLVHLLVDPNGRVISMTRHQLPARRAELDD